MNNTSTETNKMRALIVEALQDVKAEEIITLDLRKLDDTVSDFYIVCHGNSNTQVMALADAVYKKVKDEMRLFPKAQEGKESAQWMILDYFDVVVHIFYKEAREYYQIEELWSDAKTIQHA